MYLAVVNPISGTKNKVNPETLVFETLGSKVNVDWLYWSSADMDIITAIRQKLEQKKYEIVIVFGGDGTVNHVAQALVGHDEAMLIIPMGSGNGLARHLRIPMNYKKALKLALNPVIKKIDVASINGQFFTCSSGVGFDATIAYYFAHSKVRGFFTYFKLVLKWFFKYHCDTYQIEIDDKKLNEKAFFITVANANQWGNNIKVAPQAIIDDGQFDVVILREFKWYHVPILVIKLLIGKINSSKHCMSIKANKVNIFTSKPTVYAHYDGESVELNTPLSFTITKQLLHVVVGKNH